MPPPFPPMPPGFGLPFFCPPFPPTPVPPFGELNYKVVSFWSNMPPLSFCVFLGIPPPMPPPGLAHLNDEELQRMECAARDGIAARLQCLQNIQQLLDAAVLLMQQYSNAAATAATNLVHVPLVPQMPTVPTASTAVNQTTSASSSSSSSSPPTQPNTTLNRYDTFTFCI